MRKDVCVKKSSLGILMFLIVALLLMLICIDAACAAGFLVGWVTPAVSAMLVLAVKYYAVYSCWGDFQRYHR